MTDQGREDLQRLTELLADRASGDLADVDRAELDRLLAEMPGAAEVAAEYDQVEGGLSLSASEPREALPPGLRVRLAAQGRALVAGGTPEVAGSRAAIVGPFPIDRDRRAGGVAGDVPVRGVSRGSFPSMLGWLVAAAAVALAAVAWWPGGSAEPSPSLASQRQTLVESAADASVTLLDTTDDPAASGVIADVVWSDAKQRGYLRIRGLAINEPTREQYQVWVTDAARDEHPVSAGVFDVAQGSIDPVTREVIVPLAPGLSIGRAQSFALTIERPGGVVVSEMGRLVASGRVG